MVATQGRKSPLVSVIISTYNRKEKLARLIDSLLKSDYSNLEIIIIDDNSKDGTYDYVKKLYGNDKRITIIRNNREKFTSYNWNLGLKLSRGKYILILGDDMVVERDCIKKLVNFLEEKLEFVVVAPVVYDMSGKIWNAGVKRHYMGINTTYNIKTLLNKLEYIAVDECNTIFMIRKSDFQKINGFNENIEFYYEESEMFYRLKKATNKKIACLLSAKAYHDIEKNKLGIAITTFLFLIFTYYLYVFLILNNLSSWISLIKGFLKGVLSGGVAKWAK